MAGKKSLVIWGCTIIVAIWVWFVGFASPAIAETLNFKIYHYVAKSERALIGDVEGHILSQTTRRGFFLLENGEVATWVGTLQNDLIKGSGSYILYATVTFSDGSTIIMKTEGTLGGGGTSSIKSGAAKTEIIKGTGRFEGIKGTGTTTAKYLPPEKGEDGQKGITEGTLNYTLPSK